MADYTSKNDEEFFGAIGRLTISWAGVEFGLDCAVNVIHRFLGGERINPEAPRTSLYRKISYIRKWGKTAPEPGFCAAVEKLMDDIEAAAETRHDLIHGIIVEYAEDSGAAKMIRLLHSPKTHTPQQKRFSVNTAEILEAAVAAGKLESRALNLGTGLQELIPILAEIVKKAKGEVGG